MANCKIIICVALCAAALTQGCSTIGKLHTQAGVVVGQNYGDEPLQGFDDTQAVAELGYVSGESKTNAATWGFGGTGYLLLGDPMLPGIKAMARRRLNPDTSLDFSAGPMITYNSSGTFNGFIGGVALNVHFITIRSEYMTWPVEPWDEYIYRNGVEQSVIHHPSGHENVWFNGVTMNGTASWITAAVGLGVLIVVGAMGGFE